MDLRILVLLLVVSPCHAAEAPAATVQREPWQTPYAGSDAGGQHVLGLWSFDGPDGAADSSSHHHKADLEGAEIVPAGRFGSALQSAPGWPVEDKSHRLLVKNHPALSPQGPFTLELWIKADDRLKGYPESFLIDKKYVAHADYQLILGGEDRGSLRALSANLGFGTRSATWSSEPLKIDVGTWYHIAFTYDGAGTGRFFVNGELKGAATVDGLRDIQAGSHPLSIGDRVGSYYHGFPGCLDQVRICRGALEYRRLRFDRVSDRTCFPRMERDALLRFSVANLQRTAMGEAALTWTLDGRSLHTESMRDLAAGEVRAVACPLDTSLRPDRYYLEAQLDVGGEEPLTVRDRFPIQIVARRPPGEFPVVMWGAGPDDIQPLKRIGFTHALGVGADYARIWEAGSPVDAAPDDTVRRTRAALDGALAEGVSFAASLSPSSWLGSQERFQRVDRSGKPFGGEPDICGLFPEIAPFFFNVGASVARTYGDLPAFRAALLNTEVRDGARPCFHPHDLAAFKKDTGIDLPVEVQQRWGVSHAKLAGFPADRVIPDNHPLYVYYQWYWKRGDGWNQLNGELHRGLTQMKRDDFWTWHDPAVRVASVYGSGGDVDVISQWTYSYPDPIRIGVATDELLAMARGSGRKQDVMKMTQIIWYRSQTAPEASQPGGGPSYQARWEREQPDAPFITIPPMHLREAFWTKIARPIKGIMYHGWQSLVPDDPRSGYRYTHSQTQHELQRLIETVVRPLGPSLLQIGSAPSDVAFYESFSSQVFAQRGTYGWGGNWPGDAYQVCLWAGLQPDIVFDETIVQEGLDRFKVLIMPDCDVLTDSVAKRISAFQQRGGVVVGDDRTAPAVKCDITMSPFDRTGHAERDKAALQAIAATLRNSLAGRYDRYADSSNPDVIPYRRRHGGTDYLFVVNDHREYGRYVGHHGRVMENGLPSQATLSVARDKGHVYDLVGHSEVATRQEGGSLQFDVALGPSEGGLYMLVARAIEGLQLEAPDSARRGDQVVLEASVVDGGGQPVDAVVPLLVTVEDAEGRQAEFSGYWAAVGGRAKITLDIAANDPAGTWTIAVTELASGRNARRYVRVLDDAAPTGDLPLNKDAANPVQPKG